VIDDPCSECRGSGAVTKTRTLTVRIPAGVVDGQRIRLHGKGEPGRRGGRPGDLFVVVHVRPDRLFGRSGDDLTITVPVTYSEAVFGTSIRVPTLDGAVTLRVPPGTPSGRTMRARGRGVTRKDGTAGDLLVTVEVTVPKQLSADAAAALAAYAEASAETPRAHLEAEAARRG